MTTAKTAFVDALGRAGNLIQIGAFLEGKPVAGLDSSECYRAALVLGVSCLDHYIHTLVREAVVATAQGARNTTPKFLEIHVPLTSAQTNLNSGSWGWLGAIIQEQFSQSTLQRPDKISEAIKMLDSRQRLWERLATRIGTDSTSLKNRLNLIVDRRNMIAHEADIDPTWNKPRPLARHEVESAFELINKLVDAIDLECW